MSISKMLQELLGDVDLQEYSARAVRDLDINETLNQIRNIDFTKLWEEAQARARHVEAEEQRKRDEERNKELMRQLMQSASLTEKAPETAVKPAEQAITDFWTAKNKALVEENTKLAAALEIERENTKIIRDTMVTAIELIEALELRQAITYLQWGVERKGSSDVDS